MDAKKEIENEAYNITLIKNKIQNAINDFMIENDIQDLKSEPLQVFSACITYAGRAVFSPDFLTIDRQRKIYNYVLIDNVADYYLYICKLYNKTSSLYDFSILINIRYRILQSWRNDTSADAGADLLEQLTTIYNIDYNKYINTIKSYIVNNEGDKLTAMTASIFDKLHTDREHALTARLVGNQNAIGTITAVNKEYLWNVQQAQQLTTARALSLAELPNIDNL